MRIFQRIGFSALSLLFLLDLCWSMSSYVEPPKPTVPNAGISLEFSSFSSFTNSFIDDVKRQQLTTLSDTNGFRKEVLEYISRLPKGATRIVTIKSRNVCHCEGKMMSPCPARCLYSCFIHAQYAYTDRSWHYEDDCRGRTKNSCKCTEDSSISCNNDLEACITETTKFEPDTPCSQYTIDGNDTLRTFDLVSNFLMEPLNKHLRDVTSQLAQLKRKSLNIQTLSDLVDRMDWATDGASQADQLLPVEKADYNHLKKNITLNLIKTQSLIERCAQQVEELKEMIYAKLNRLIMEYSCCQEVTGISKQMIYDCSGYISSQTSNQTEPTLLSVTEESKTVDSGDW